MSASSYIVSGSRTPIGKFLGGLSSLSAPQLAAASVKETLARASFEPSQVEEAIFGCVLPAGIGQAPARQAALLAGIPGTVAALTVNKVCGSGLKAVMLADQAIRLGDAGAIVAGGTENMSRAPFLLTGVRGGWKFGDQLAVDSMQRDGLWCAFEDKGMGEIAEYTATKHKISRIDQDAFSAESHKRAIAAVKAGAFDAEIVPITIAGKTETIIKQDEGPRADTSPEGLAKLRTSFAKDGTVTAGNSSQISDGAASVLVLSEALASKCKTPWKARIVASATSGGEPRDLFTAPVEAVRKALAKAKLSVGDIDLFELNEAFACQALACVRPLEIDPTKVNVNGGAIALGHPIGASGARVLVTLLHALHARGLKRGVASLCLGGGEAVAMVVEMV